MAGKYQDENTPRMIVISFKMKTILIDRITFKNHVKTKVNNEDVKTEKNVKTNQDYRG